MQAILTSLVSCRSVDEAAVGAWIQILPGKSPHLFTHSFSSIFVPSQGLASPQTVAKQAANQCSSAGSPRAELLKLCMLCHVKSCQSLVVCCIFISTDSRDNWLYP